MTSLYNRYVSVCAPEEQSYNQATLEGLALAQLVSFIEETRHKETTIFKLCDLVRMYSSRLQQLGANVPSKINSTRLKDRLVSIIPDLRPYTEGRDVMHLLCVLHTKTATQMPCIWLRQLRLSGRICSHHSMDPSSLIAMRNQSPRPY